MSVAKVLAFEPVRGKTVITDYRGCLTEGKINATFRKCAADDKNQHWEVLRLGPKGVRYISASGRCLSTNASEELILVNCNKPPILWIKGEYAP